jgi:translation initiation factor IF-3
VTDLGFVESSPKQDGRNMTMVIGPHKKKSEAKAEVKAAKQERAAARQAEKDTERAEIRAAHPTPSPKKERGRSENLDPEIEA